MEELKKAVINVFGQSNIYYDFKLLKKAMMLARPQNNRIVYLKEGKDYISITAYGEVDYRSISKQGIPYSKDFLYLMKSYVFYKDKVLIDGKRLSMGRLMKEINMSNRSGSDSEYNALIQLIGSIYKLKTPTYLIARYNFPLVVTLGDAKKYTPASFARKFLPKKYMKYVTKSTCLNALKVVSLIHERCLSEYLIKTILTFKTSAPYHDLFQQTIGNYYFLPNNENKSQTKTYNDTFDAYVLGSRKRERYYNSEDKLIFEYIVQVQNELNNKLRPLLQKGDDETKLMALEIFRKENAYMWDMPQFNFNENENEESKD